MQDIELYRQLLGLTTPWTVLRVELQVKTQRVEVWAGHAESARWPCPECAAVLPVYDHAEDRVWRHLDSCQFQTYLHARPPRVQCPTHGVRQVRLPWAEPRARFTTLFERLAIDVLRETDVQGATRLLGISWDEAWEIKRRAVARGRARRRPYAPARLGIDETAIARGHDYLTLVCNLATGTVEYLADERKQASLDGYFIALSAAQRAGIEAVAMDMWEPYVQAVQAHVPGAARKIVFDAFPLVQHMNSAVDQVGRQEHRLRAARGERTRRAPAAATRTTVQGASISLPAARRAGIEAVAVDLWERYVPAVQAHGPWAARKIAVDAFPLVPHMRSAGSRAGRREHRLRAAH